MVMTGVNVMKQKRQQTIRMTVLGTATKLPQRINTITCKVIVTMSVLYKKHQAL